MAINHRYLEGKKVKYVSGRIKQNGIVVNIDRSIGISIVDENDKTDKLVCLNGPKTKVYKEDKVKLKNYNKCFNEMINDIVNGKVDASNERFDMIYHGHPITGGRLATCPYSGE